jgi:hypothetical protein
VLIENRAATRAVAGKSPYLQPFRWWSVDRIGEIVRAEIVPLVPIRYSGGSCRTGPRRGASLKPPDRSAPFMRQEFKRTPGEDAAAEITLAFDDNRHASLVFGQYDQNLAKLERKLGVIANANGNHVTIKGPAVACERARLVLENLYARVELGQPVGLGDVDGAIEEGAMQGTCSRRRTRPGAPVSANRHRRRGSRAQHGARPLPPRDEGHELVFAEGPPAPETWLTVGFAVLLLEQGVNADPVAARLEAGQARFPPGDMRDKVIILRPIYDALPISWMPVCRTRIKLGSRSPPRVQRANRATPASCSTKGKNATSIK